MEMQTVSSMSMQSPSLWSSMSQQSAEAVLGGLGVGVARDPEMAWRRRGRRWPGIRGSARPNIYHVAGQEETPRRTQTLPASHSRALP